MGNETKNYKFPKPSEDDFYDITEYNKAMDILDETLTGMSDRKLDRNGNASNVVTEFSQEIIRDNIKSGEKLSVSHGKVQKWFSEMKNIAFSGLASDVTQDAAHRFATDTEKSNWNAKVSASGGDISGTKIGSLETITSEFPVPSEGETPKMFLGKVKKFIQDFNDFKTGVITVGKLVNNGQTTGAGYALDARYGKTLYDLYAQLNADLGNKLNNTGGVITGNLSIQKNVPIYEMMVSDTLRGRIQKNAGGGIDYGTEIVDVAGNVATTLVITNGKLRLGKRVDGVIVGTVDIASIP
jgi:hypothetical protein